MGNFNAISKCYQLVALHKLKIKPEGHFLTIVNADVIFLQERILNGLKWPLAVVPEKPNSLLQTTPLFKARRT